MVEAFYVDCMLDVGGVIALHDLWMPGLEHFAAFWCSNRPDEPVTVTGGSVSAAPCESGQRECGDLDAASPFFRARLAPYVDASVLLLRRCDEDRRQPVARILDDPRRHDAGDSASIA